MPKQRKRMYSIDELDLELARRRVFPPLSLKLFPEQYCWETTTAEALRIELDAMAADDPDREWCEWELALAERQAVVEPLTPFRRVVARRPQ